MAALFRLVVLLCCAFCVVSGIPNRKKRDAALSYTANVDLLSSHHTTDNRFLSLALSAYMCSRLHKFKVDSVKLQNLAAALGPAVIRVGGEKGNFNIINPDNRNLPVTTGEIGAWEDKLHEEFWTGLVGKRDWSNANCTGEDLTKLFTFFEDADWSIMYQLNHQLDDQNNQWDPQNADLMLRHLDSQGIDIEFLQLTNEPNGYRKNFAIPNDEQKVVDDFAILHHYLKFDGPERYRNAKLVGPDTSSRKSSKSSYLWQVMQKGLGQYLDALGVHLYYINGPKATINDYLNSTVYEFGEKYMDNAINVVNGQEYDLKIYLSETASSYAGGAAGITNRYVGTLLWLDELGVAALKGVSMVNRQTFWAGKYALIEFRNYDPTPSFWISLVHKQIIEGPVLKLSLSPESKEVRVYAHCAKTDGPHKYPAGAVVVYYINLLGSEIELSLDQFAGHEYDVFLFTKIDHVSEDEALTSIDIKLNGEVLTMEGDVVPELHSANQSGAIKIAAHGVGFVVIKTADALACKPSN